MDVKQHGLYFLSDSYFQKYNTGKMMDNKSESRPHYFALEMDHVIWMIPLSGQVEKYREKISASKNKGQQCVYYHIGKIAGKQCAFLIGDMIPVSTTYISREYTISGVPYVVKNETLNRQLTAKAKRYLLLVQQNQITPYVDILKIKKDLLK